MRSWATSTWMARFTSPAIARALIRAEAAQPFPWAAGNAEWVTWRIRSVADLRHAERLMRMAYEHLGGTPETGLIEALSLPEEDVRAHGKAVDDSAP